MLWPVKHINSLEESTRLRNVSGSETSPLQETTSRLLLRQAGHWISLAATPKCV